MAQKILDVGAGPNKYPNSISIDLNPKTPSDIVHDLNEFPWPVDDDSFDIIYSSHCLEHLKGNNAIKAIEEMYRICKNGGLIMLRLPHYSGRIAWCSPEHVKPFSVNLMNHFNPSTATTTSKVHLQQVKVELHWNSTGNRNSLRYIGKVIDFFANMQVYLCERIWCYWVGGFDKVYFEAKVVK